MKSSWFLQIGIALILALMSFLFYFQPVFAEDAQLEIINGPFTIQPDPEADNALIALVLVRNNGPAIEQLTFRAIGDDGQEIQISQPEQQGIGGYTIQEYLITFQDTFAEDISGQLIVEGENVSPASELFSIDAPSSIQRWPFLNGISINSIMFLSFIIGVVLFCVICLIYVSYMFRKVSELNFLEHFNYRIGGLSWDFSKNWASSFVAIGALLGTVLGDEILPEDTQLLSIQDYQVINILVGSMILLSPLLLACLNSLGKELTKTKVSRKSFSKSEKQPTETQTPIKAEEKEGPPIFIVDSEGKTPLIIWAYIIGSAIVVWAVVAEIMTLICWIEDIYLASTIPSALRIFCQLTLLLIAGISIKYAVEKVYQTSCLGKNDDEIVALASKEGIYPNPTPTVPSGTKRGEKQQPPQVEQPIYRKVYLP